MESYVPKGQHRLLLYFKGDLVSNGSSLIYKDPLVNDYFFSGTSNKREVTITFNQNIPDGFYAYDMDIHRSVGKDKGMDIRFYGTPNDTEFICKSLYRFWAKNVNSNGQNYSTGFQNKQAGRFLRANGGFIQIHGQFELKEPHVYNHGRPYTLNIDGDNGECYEFLSQHLSRNDAYHGRLFTNQMKFVFEVDGTHSTTFENTSEFKLFGIE